jgi:serine/threonine protein kinase
MEHSPAAEVPCVTCGHDHAGTCPELSSDRRIGQVVDGKYHILRRLACGGMGTVYEARHVVVGRHFALKFLHDHYARRNSMVQRFLREAQAAGSIASEHIIGVLDYGSADGTPYLVMELVRGQDLRELLAVTPRLPATRAVRIIIDACRGLSLAHDRGLVHRDLKPANICITHRGDGREMAKVIDFGVAKLRDGLDLSDEGTLIGTVGYMAPEQLTDQRQLDARADIYALGVILYQALSGRPPHVCDRSELLYRIVSVDPVGLDELCPDLPEGLAAVVHRALMRRKERRYENVRDFALALEPFANDAAAALDAAPEVAPALRSSRAPGLGTAETELESAPTWVALSRNGNPRADRHCQYESSREAALDEDFCRQPVGATPVLIPPAHQHMSQRALMLSVGALALSVVAMTTMFIFVYSHGSRALESAATPTHPAVNAHASAVAVAPPPRESLASENCAAHDSRECPLSSLHAPASSSGVDARLSDSSTLAATPALSVEVHALQAAPKGSSVDAAPVGGDPHPPGCER